MTKTIGFWHSSSYSKAQRHSRTPGSTAWPLRSTGLQAWNTDSPAGKGLDPSTDDTEFVGGYDLAADEDVVVDDSSDESSTDSESDSESEWDEEREDDLEYVLEKCARRAVRRRQQCDDPFG